MNQKISPVAAAVVAVVLVVGVLFVGGRMLKGASNGGSEGEAVIVKPSNPNDPKFTQNLPSNIAGGVSNSD